ncbi:hypothetical protein D9757_006902 [Collybiopsis confluens]|uniref:Ty3 transposon capsid-like protein domain-containing protein n=1 Tax=Collybiopsis confluens TaxID=2823264 RepID=A0A8H5HPJ0_9AGAR|nr:hypothetical protein D9757_006902 [Collybiopsis confluens]
MSEYDSGGFDLRLNMGPPVMPSPMIPQTPQPSNESAFVQSITHKFNSLDSNFSQLFDEVQKLTSLISQGSAAPQPPPPAPAPAAAPVPVAVTSQGKPPSFEKPDRFKGKSSEVETFVDAIQDAIELQGNSLATERSKCIYMSTFLENSPKQWYRGIKKSHPHLLDNFSLFLKAFIDHFGDSNLAYNATGKLEKLTQTGSAAAYAAKFRELLVYVNWTEESKINQFYKNLKPATKDLIATKKRSKHPAMTLRALVRKIIPSPQNTLTILRQHLSDYQETFLGLYQPSQRLFPCPNPTHLPTHLLYNKSLAPRSSPLLLMRMALVVP